MVNVIWSQSVHHDGVTYPKGSRFYCSDHTAAELVGRGLAEYDNQKASQVAEEKPTKAKATKKNAAK